MSSRDDDDDTPVRRLRVPAALTVAFVGSSAMVAMWYGGCGPNKPDPGPDAGRIESLFDADTTDAADALPDPDARVSQTPDELPADANEPPH